MHQVVEGVHTIKAISPLARGLGLDLPVINLIHGVLFEDLPVSEVASMFGGLEGQHSPDYS
jgi:glycerol-3-phosphate dehydrogenase